MDKANTLGVTGYQEMNLFSGHLPVLAVLYLYRRWEKMGWQGSDHVFSIRQCEALDELLSGRMKWSGFALGRSDSGKEK